MKKFKEQWENKVKKIRKDQNGFTLVEVIIVLVIIAILASLVIGAYTSYIDDAKRKAMIVDAESVYKAAQAAVSEEYGLYDQFMDSINKKMADGTKVGRVTNNYLCAAQKKSYSQAQLKNTTDQKIALKVLKYLDSYDKDTARYVFEKDTNPLGKNVQAYSDSNNQPGIIIAYDQQGYVMFIEFGYDDLMVRIEKGEVTVVTDGTFSTYPKD